MSDKFDAEKIKSFLINKNLKTIEAALNAIDTDKLSKEITTSIQTRTRLGRDKDNRPFDGLADSTEKTREKSKSKLSSKTRPGKSNQTFTGQMVDSIKMTVEKTKNSLKFWGGFDNSRDDGKSNSEIHEYNVMRGRDFYGLAPYQIKLVQRLIRQMWLKVFKKS